MYVPLPRRLPIAQLGGKMTALFLVCLILLLQLFSVPSGSVGPRQGQRTWCHGSGACYSVHLARLNFTGAKEACAKHGGRLSTATGKVEVQAIFALLRGVAADASSGTSLFWLGLVRKAQRCTNADLPLRSFSWDPAELPEALANETTETPAWLKEPSKSCVTQKCAGLQVTSTAPPYLQPWGLMESSCNNPSPGYICKYRYDGVCAALLPPGSGSLGYTLPYQVQSSALEFSPLGTVLTLRCPTREARFTCRRSPDGYHWTSNERRLCSCPSGYWSPSKGECVEAAADCVGAQGAFLCLCAWGSRLAADEESCLQAQNEGRAGVPGPATPAAGAAPSLSNITTSLPPGQNSSLEPFPSGVVNSSSGPAVEETLVHPDSSNNYIFILITVSVVMLVILVMAALQSFQICCKICSSKGSRSHKDVAPAAAAEGDPEVSATRTNSEHSLGPSKAESAEVSQEDPKPADRELEQTPGDWDSLQGKNLHS